MIRVMPCDTATESDLNAIVQMITASIRACTADHNNSEADIRVWLANKTTANIAKWIQHNQAWIAVEDRDNAPHSGNSHNSDLVTSQNAGNSQYKVVGFVLVSQKGEVLLNYVHPSSQRQGVGKQLMTAVKKDAKHRGLSVLFLESTLTAKSFYLNQGFKVLNEVKEGERLVGFDMVMDIDKPSKP